MNKLKIKKGDTVKILSGKDKGKTGKILQVLPKLNKVVVESVNMRTRFERSKKAGEKGKKVTFPAPMQSSKLMLVDASSGSTTRIGYSFLENGKKQRISKKSNKAV
jgi:large subunit ribosomal protein L24